MMLAEDFLMTRLTMWHSLSWFHSGVVGAIGRRGDHHDHRRGWSGPSGVIWPKTCNLGSDTNCYELELVEVVADEKFEVELVLLNVAAFLVF
jgi:hypothetical protein